MSITTTNHAKALYPGVSAWYGDKYDEHKPEYPDLFDIEKSSRAYEEDVGLVGFPLAEVKSEGQGIAYAESRTGYITRYNHLVYGLGFAISREAIEDDQYDVTGKRNAESLAFSLRQTEEIVHANIYNRAFNSSYTGGDGKELLATDHPNFSGGTWSNELATAVDLDQAALEQACIDIMKWENDIGHNIQVMPRSLIIPPDLWAVAERVVHSQYENETANNAINPIFGKFPEGIKVNHYLTDSDAWFIRTNAPHGMKSYLRRPMEFTTDSDFDTENAKYKATVRFSAGWTDPRGLFGSPGG